MTRATGLAQPTVSRHLQVLHRAGLLLRTRQGSRTYYQCGAGALEALARELTAGHHGRPQARDEADLLNAVAASAWQGRTTVAQLRGAGQVTCSAVVAGPVPQTLRLSERGLRPAHRSVPSLRQADRVEQEIRVRRMVTVGGHARRRLNSRAETPMLRR